MNDEIKLLTGQENQIDFELDIKGAINPHTALCRFFIVTETVTYILPCEKKDGSNFCVKVPNLPLPNVSYACGVEVIADGYYFKPYEGHITFDGAPSVEIKNTLSVSEPIPSPKLAEPPVNIQAPKISESKETFHAKLRKSIGINTKVKNAIIEVEELTQKRKLLQEREEKQLTLKHKKIEEAKHAEEQNIRAKKEEKNRKIREVLNSHLKNKNE